MDNIDNIDNIIKPSIKEFLTLDFNNDNRVRDYNNERMKRINKQIKKQKTNHNKNCQFIN